MPRPTVFISHNNRDIDFASRLDQDLRDAGAETFLDQEDARTGPFQDHINAALAKCEWFVLVLTPNALASDWVQQEVDTAIILKHEGQIRDIIIFQAEPVEMSKIPRLWRVYIRLDAAADYAFALDQTLKAIGLRPGRKPPPPEPPVKPTRVALRIGLTRTLLVTAIFSLSGLALAAVNVDGESFIPTHGVGPIEAVIAVLGVVSVCAMVAYFWLTPAGASARGQQQSSHLLFTALKQSRNVYGRQSDPRHWPALIPLTLRDYENAPTTPGKPLMAIFQESQDALLLGKTGSGKTTLLQRFALDLMDREIHYTELSELATRLPVLLSLHDWARRKQPLHRWIARQFMGTFDAQGLPSVHGLSRSLINRWIRQGSFILLLDGLDEMSDEDSRACIGAINKFHQNFPSRLIISCELERYQRLAGESHLLNVGQKTVVVQPVAPQEAHEYFEQLGAKKLAELARREIEHPSGQFPDTPLILNVMAQTYPDDSPNWQTPVDMSEHALMRQYVIQAVGSHPARYSGMDAQYWLTQLARHMENTPYFQFRSDYLPSNWARAIYLISTWLIIGLLAVAACVPVALRAFPSWQLLAALALIAGLYGYAQLLPILGFIPGLYGFLVKSVVTGLFMIVLYVLTLALPFFAFASSSKRSNGQKFAEVVAALTTILLPTVLVTTLIVIGADRIGVPVWLGLLCECLLGGLLWYALYRLKFLQFLLQTGSKETVLYTWLTVTYMMIVRLVEPFASQRLSPRASTPRGLTRGLMLGCVAGLIVWSLGALFWHTNLLLAAVLIGVSVWLDRGLGASLRGYLLRFWFYQYRMLPWNPRFLDDVVATGLLEAQGEGYGFVYHDALRNYFRGDWRQ